MLNLEMSGDESGSLEGAARTPSIWVQAWAGADGGVSLAASSRQGAWLRPRVRQGGAGSAAGRAGKVAHGIFGERERGFDSSPGWLV